jgi:hypothetical protein
MRAQALDGAADGLISQQPPGEALLRADLGGQRECPQSRRLANEPRGLMQQVAQLVALRRVQRRLGTRGPVRTRRQTAHAPYVERTNDVADGLARAAEEWGKRSRGRPLGTGQHNLRTPHATPGGGAPRRR